MLPHNLPIHYFTLFLSLFLFTAEANSNDAVDIAADVAEKHISYDEGGNGLDVFDCSGLTKYVYGSVGIDLTRRAVWQSTEGALVIDDIHNIEKLQRGDLLFFQTDDKKPNEVTHVGIYEGNNIFINAQWYGVGVVRGNLIEDEKLGEYWYNRFLFARRLPPPPGPSTKFKINDMVEVTEDANPYANIKSDPLGRDLGGKQLPEAKGSIVGGPVYSSLGDPNTTSPAFWRWLVDFESGPDGWVAEGYLKKVGSPPPSNVLEDFESYPVGSIASQGNWSADSVGTVVESVAYQGSKSLLINTFAGIGALYSGISPITGPTVYLSMYVKGNTTNTSGGYNDIHWRNIINFDGGGFNINLCRSGEGLWNVLATSDSIGNDQCVNGVGERVMNEWTRLDIEVKLDTSEVRSRLGGSDWSSYIHWGVQRGELNSMRMENTWATGDKTYVDLIELSLTAPPN